MGSLDGIRVLEISRGVAGAMAGMLLGDHGAEVIKLEPLEGDPTRRLSGSPVWNRGKRSVVLELERARERERLLRLAAGADVLITELPPRESARLGIDHPRLAPACPRLVQVSITGYGRDNPHSERPAIDALVAARSGMQWEQRGWFGAPTDHVAGIDAERSAWEVPPRAEQTGHREGPIFLAHPWPSIGAALLAVAGALSALYVRERTGRGQHVETSLLQGVLLQSGHLYQKLENPEQSGYRLWYYDRRAPKGLFECSDGGWLHQWPPIDHGFAAAAARGDRLVQPDEEAVRELTPPAQRGMTDLSYEDAVRQQAELGERTAQHYLRFPRDRWLEVLHAAGRGAAPVRSPEEALADEALLADGAIVELEDPDHGSIRQMGILQGMSATPGAVRGPAPRVGADSGSLPEPVATPEPARRGAPPARALEGVVVLDFGLAMAGPFGAQLLADLGADVIKVNSSRAGLDFGNWMAVGVERGKRSLSIDLKHTGSREVLERLVRRADVVHHNMRVGVAERLGIDEPRLRALNERLIYCHTLGWEREGPRTHLPGTDQMGNALAGTAYEAGGMHAGGRPVWHPNSMGDLGNGALSALVVLQALYHRERSGAGQRVDTSIAFAALLFNSFTWTGADGRGPARPRIDAQQLGTGPLYRLYRTADDGWICLAVTAEPEWRGLLRAIGEPGLDAIGFVPPWMPARPADATLAQRLELAFSEAPAGEWQRRLDRAGVPCEISSRDFAREIFEDPGAYERGWVVACDHPTLGRLAQPGCLVGLSETPGEVQRPSPLVGQHTREILRELDFSAQEIERLHADGVVRSLED